MRVHCTDSTSQGSILHSRYLPVALLHNIILPFIPTWDTLHTFFQQGVPHVMTQGQASSQRGYTQKTDEDASGTQKHTTHEDESITPPVHMAWGKLMNIDRPGETIELTTRMADYFAIGMHTPLAFHHACITRLACDTQC